MGIPTLDRRRKFLGANFIGIGVFGVATNWYFEIIEIKPILTAIKPNRLPTKYF